MRARHLGTREEGVAVHSGPGGGRSVTSRALAVLAAFDVGHRRLTLSEIARRGGLSLTTTHRLVGELVAWDALERGDDGRYVIGQRIWELGLLAPVQHELRAVARPYLQDLYDATRENAHLAVLDETEALYVEHLSGRASVPVLSTAGSRLPLHATGVGKVLLAHAPQDLQETVLGSLRAITPHTVVEPERLRRELAEVRQRGYATTAEEMSLRTFSVAAPVVTVEGAVVAAVGLVTTTARRDLQRLAPAVQVAAAGVGRRLGPSDR